MHICIYTYVPIQGDNSLLTKRNKKVLKSEQIVCSQRILNQIKKKNSEQARNFFANNNVWKLLILP